MIRALLKYLLSFVLLGGMVGACYYWPVLLLFCGGLLIGFFSFYVYCFVNLERIMWMFYPLIVGNKKQRQRIVQALLPSLWFSRSNDIIIEVQTNDSKVKQIRIPVKKLGNSNKFLMVGNLQFLKRIEVHFTEIFSK